MLQPFLRLFYPVHLVELHNNVGKDLSLQVCLSEGFWTRAGPNSKPYQILRASSLSISRDVSTIYVSVLRHPHRKEFLPILSLCASEKSLILSLSVNSC